MSFPTGSVYKKRNNENEWTHEEQDKQLKKTKEYVITLHMIYREIEYITKDIKKLKIVKDANANVINSLIVEPSLESYGEMIEMNAEKMIATLNELHSLTVRLIGVFSNPLQYPRSFRLYEIVHMGFQFAFKIIRRAIYCSLLLCDKTKNESWLVLSRSLFGIADAINSLHLTLFMAFREIFRMMMDYTTSKNTAIIWKYVEGLQDMSKKNNAMIDSYRVFYLDLQTEFKKHPRQNLTNQHNRGGRRSHKKRVKRNQTKRKHFG